MKLDSYHDSELDDTSHYCWTCLDWAKSYKKTNFENVLFTDEFRATLDGPDGWMSGWLLHGKSVQPNRARSGGNKAAEVS